MEPRSDVFCFCFTFFIRSCFTLSCPDSRWKAPSSRNAETGSLQPPACRVAVEPVLVAAARCLDTSRQEICPHLRCYAATEKKCILAHLHVAPEGHKVERECQSSSSQVSSRPQQTVPSASRRRPTAHVTRGDGTRNGKYVHPNSGDQVTPTVARYHSGS